MAADLPPIPLPIVDAQDRPVREKAGLVDNLILLFVAVFIVPIMFLTGKFLGGGTGFGPAFASFTAATLIVLVGVVAAVVSVIAGIVVLVHHFV